MTDKFGKPTWSIPPSAQAELTDAYDFDPKDPMFGLRADEMSGSALSRRSVLRLLAAAGTLSAYHLLPGTGAIGQAQAAAGGTLTCGWAGVGEITTLDPHQINQVLLFQIASNVISGLTHDKGRSNGDGRTKPPSSLFA